jgi:putative beta-lysine N-acetyltransferase
MIQPQQRGELLLRKVQAGGDSWEAAAELDMVNQRVKLKEYQYESHSGLSALGEYLLSLARDEGYGKVLAEVREEDWERFLGRGFAPEGLIPGYFQGDVAYLMAYYLDTERQASSRLEQENEVLEKVLEAEPLRAQGLDPRFSLEPATEEDAPELAGLFRRVFITYPTPLHDAAYVAKLIQSREGVFRIVRDDGRLVSSAAAEVDWAKGNAEMTNCATLPDYRGEGLMASILADLEVEMSREGVGCLFSIARASSHGMNMVLQRLGYRYQGRLVNNCHIMGDFEDMNIWVR